jgi:hypothetical protein
LEILVSIYIISGGYLTTSQMVRHYTFYTSSEAYQAYEWLTVLTLYGTSEQVTHYPTSNAWDETMSELTRGERLQIMLTEQELKALDDWRFARRMPSRASAVRELLRRGLDAEGFNLASAGQKSQDFGVTNGDAQSKRTPNGES